MYYLPDNWLQFQGYGLVERMMDVLKFEESRGKNVSQVVVTFPQWKSSAHIPLSLQKTNHFSPFYELNFIKSNV